MKNWQFFTAIIILVVLTSIKIKERFDPITYDIGNTINYNDSLFNKMSQDLFKKNKQTIREEDDLIKKNIKINEDIPACNVSVTTNRARYKDEVIPMNKKCNEYLQTRGIELNKCFADISDKNKELDLYNSQIPEIDRIIAETDRNEKIARAAYDKRANPPTGWYTIKSSRTGQYCCDEADGHMVCNRGAIGAWEKFYFINLGGGYYNIKGGRSGRYCVDDGHFSCNRGAAGPWERTQVFYLGGGNYYMRGGKDGKICSLDGVIRCNGGHVQQWETFQIQPI
jgi:hypothetical protein